jgi:radical SAM/SPASM domain protein of ACGX system
MCRKVNRIPYFYITGGDPILHSRFWDLLELLKSDNIAFTVLGNPFHLTDEVCSRLKEYGCERYQLSIDGLRETHDAMRKSGSFDTTSEKIKVLRDAGIRCAIMTTVSGTNAHEMAEIIDTVVAYKADIFAFGRYCPTGFEKSTHLTPEEYRELLEVCWQKFEQYKGSGTSFYLKDHLWTLFLYEKGLFQIPGGLDDNTIYEGCNCANCHLTILPKGEVYACRRMESNVGNVFGEKLFDIFTGDSMDYYRDYNKFEKCSKCELKRFCRGCPAVAYGYTGNFYAADPQCWKRINS